MINTNSNRYVSFKITYIWTASPIHSENCKRPKYGVLPHERIQRDEDHDRLPQ